MAPKKSISAGRVSANRTAQNKTNERLQKDFSKSMQSKTLSNRIDSPGKQLVREAGQGVVKSLAMSNKMGNRVGAADKAAASGRRAAVPSAQLPEYVRENTKDTPPSQIRQRRKSTGDEIKGSQGFLQGKTMPGVKKTKGR